ncbi:MAG: DoxX family protein [Thermoleophilaceae bacterium]
MKLWRLILRVLVGGLFIGHGTQKLFGWFGGHGIEGTGGFFESLGLKPGRRNAIAAGTAEAGGGALLAAGLATPLAGAAIGGTMITAIRHVHAPKGPWSTDGGWEYNAVLLAALFALLEEGPGPISLDHVLGTERCGLGWAVAALGAGAAGSYAASQLGQREAQKADQAEFAGVPFQAAEQADVSAEQVGSPQTS